jgi:hypothetical protein
MAASSNSVQSGETGLLACPSSCYKCVVSYYERHLPHWQPEGAALFLTWRLHGSLPRTVEILEPRPAGKPSSPWTGSWMEPPPVPDGFRNERVAQVVADALHYGERQLGLYQLRAWVLMIESRSHPDLSGSPPVEDHQGHQELFGAPGQCHPRAHRLAVLAGRIVRSLGSRAGGVGQDRSLY